MEFTITESWLLRVMEKSEEVILLTFLESVSDCSSEFDTIRTSVFPVCKFLLEIGLRSTLDYRLS